jgi:hypothetical protein
MVVTQTVTDDPRVHVVHRLVLEKKTDELKFS